VNALPPRRGIRSYVLRAGRVTVAQQRALATLGPRWLLPFQPQPPDFAAVFGRQAQLILEIGSGMGQATAAIAAAHPENDYLAIEVHAPGIGSLLQLIAQREISNLRLIQHDAVAVLTHMIPDGALAGIHIFFPDPWPKTRHHKRRLIQPEFAALLARKLAPEAYLHLATDWTDYAQHMLRVLDATPGLSNAHGPGATAPDPGGRPPTRFEQRGLRLGHAVSDLRYRRRD
jgi:tRNA (guanine-N7-)-methyltransferase